MIINNDKNSELTKAIINIARRQIKKGNVEGIYISAYLTSNKRKNQPQITVTSVISEISEDWSDDFDGRYTDRYLQVRNIQIHTDFSQMQDFTLYMMERREFILGQELKNAYIVYDKNSKLIEYKKSYDKEESLPLYKNRIEISPKLIKKIRQGIFYQAVNMDISETMTLHYVNPYRMTSDNMIEQIKSVMHHYKYETNEIYSPRSYIICDEENLNILKSYLMKKKENQVKYHNSLISMMRREDRKGINSTMEREEFYQECITFLEEQIPHINVKNYLDREEIETFDRIIRQSVKVKRH